MFIGTYKELSIVADDKDKGGKGGKGGAKGAKGGKGKKKKGEKEDSLPKILPVSYTKIHILPEGGQYRPL